MSEIIQDLKNSRCRSYSWNICDRQRACSGSRCGDDHVATSSGSSRENQRKSGNDIDKLSVAHCRKRDAYSSDRTEKTDLELHKINGVIQAVTHVQCYADALSDGVIANLELASEPITSARRSNDRYESDVRITREVDNSPFIAQTGEDSTKYKWVTQNGHNISTDFRNFQLKSIEKLKTNPTLSYAKEISLILCLSSIMYCHEFKPEYLECSEKTWSEVH
ncbi:hypothetical protein RhiirC2_814496 [Rhizophagus irregularis]|uniref:Uncharacterized protein n=1 Tax=Rhizophagus irregularis TaxID=588596 RepID=A0A2N1MLK2_9GLOM|nr:hypothetical protein RhiirC2_814496 [Rhizophagus irregularis]